MSPSSTAPSAMRRRALLIVSAVARRARRLRKEALQAFEQERVACDVLVTEAPGHAKELARTHAGRYDVVFTLGGDGTAIQVITALVDGGPPVGILPGGTGNVIVRSLGIPLDVRRAVTALLHGDETRLDLGRLQDGKHFAIGLGVGLDEAMIAGASPLMKQRIGVLAYAWSATKAMARMENFQVKLTVDGTVYEREAVSVLIANLGSVLGGLVKLGDGILPDDGALHACIYSPRNFWEAIRIFVRMIRGTAHLDPRTFYVPGRQFRLETDPPRRIQADGELLGLTPLDVTVRPQAARLLIPAADPRRSSRSADSSGK